MFWCGVIAGTACRSVKTTHEDTSKVHITGALSDYLCYWQRLQQGRGGEGDPSFHPPVQLAQKPRAAVKASLVQQQQSWEGYLQGEPLDSSSGLLYELEAGRGREEPGVGEGGEWK